MYAKWGTEVRQVNKDKKLILYMRWLSQFTTCMAMSDWNCLSQTINFTSVIVAVEKKKAWHYFIDSQRLSTVNDSKLMNYYDCVLVCSSRGGWKNQKQCFLRPVYFFEREVIFRVLTLQKIIIRDESWKLTNL